MSFRPEDLPEHLQEVYRKQRRREALGPIAEPVTRGGTPNKFARAAKHAGSGMNKTEARWARFLAAQLATGQITWWAFEPLKLRLAKGSQYTPDFVMVTRSGLVVCDEVKGGAGWKLDPESRTKWKVAGELYRFFLFRGVTLTDKGSWGIEEYRPHGSWPPVSP